MTKFPSHKTHDPKDPFEIPSVEGLEPKQAAKALAGCGLKVFPCLSNGPKAKQPLCKWTREATNESEQVERLWQRDPKAAIGLSTGDTQSVGDGFALMVLDIDRKNGIDGMAPLRELETEYGVLPETSVIETPTGGFHYYFTIPMGLGIGNSAGKIGSGIDTRCNGGYVIAPGSVLEGRGRYNVISEAPIAELPQAWIDLLRNGRNAPYPNVPHQPNSPMDYRIADFGDEAVNDNLENGRSAYGDKAFCSEIDNVKHAAPGTRNDMLNTAAFSLGQLVGAGHLQEAEVRAALFEASAVNHLVRDDGEETVLATIESGLGAGKRDPRKDLPFFFAGAQLTEDLLAIEFAARFSERFRFDHTKGKWIYWTGTFWELDETGNSLDLSRQMIRPYTGKKGYRHLGKTSVAKSVLTAAASDRRLSTVQQDWNSNPWLLGVPGGYIDLQTGKMIKPNPAKLISQRTTVDPAAQRSIHPIWSKFLHEATEGDEETQRFLMQVAGYSLTGLMNEERFFFLYGRGGNGKGVFLSTIIGIFGDYAKAAPMRTFTASNHERHLTELARLHDARLVTASETEEGAKWAISRIKELTGNETPIAANFMRQDQFEYMPKFKLWFVGNNKPTLGTIDKAIMRRLTVIPFENSPQKPDFQLKENLRSEYPAILRWAIDGCLDWQKNGLLIPNVVDLASREYLEEEDFRSEWFNTRINKKQNAFTPSAEAHADWCYFAVKQGVQPGTPTTTSQWLKRQGFAMDRQNGQRGIRGIELICTEDFPVVTSQR